MGDEGIACVLSFKGVKVNTTSTLLDPIILSDTLNCNYFDVLRIPRYISDHNAAIAFIKCQKLHRNHLQEISGYMTKLILLDLIICLLI